MKIGLPKIRFSRKVLLISVGMLALLAGSGAAALYVGADTFMEAAEASPIGGECTTIQTMVLKTPAKRLWLRKYIRMEHADGSERIRTALRVAGLLAKANSVDLVQVSVLDAKGPEIRSAMRGRAIGAEVVIALQPKYLPDMKEPFIVRYYEGMPSDEGRYYGDRISLELPEIQKLMSAMKSVPDKEDCIELENPEHKSADKDAKKNEHGATVVVGEKSAEHGEQPASEKKAEGHDTPGNEAHEPAPAKEQSFLDSALSLIGLGGTEEKPAEKPAENHEAKTEDNSHAVADEPMDAAPASEEHDAKPADHAEDPAPPETDENAVEHEPVKAGDHAETPKATKSDEKHVKAEPAGHDAQPIENDAH